VVQDGEVFVQIFYPIGRNRLQFCVVGHDDFNIYIGPAVDSACKRAYDDNTINAAIIAQQTAYLSGGLFSLFGCEQWHSPPFYSTRADLVAALRFDAYCGAEEER